MNPDQRAHCRRAADRARPVLKLGDRVRVKTCAGSSTVRFAKWDETSPDFFVSKSGVDELHPFNVSRINGEPVSFRDNGASV